MHSQCTSPTRRRARVIEGSVVTGVVVTTWHPTDASRLQQALRLTNEAFAETLGAAPRTVAKWHANPTIALTLEMQAALDTLLQRASPEVQRRFEKLAAASESAVTIDADVRRANDLLESASHLHSSLAWLDEVRRGDPGTTFRAVVQRAISGPIAGFMPWKEERPSRQALATKLLNYYAREDAVRGAVFLDTPDGRLETSLVTPHGVPAASPLGLDAQFEFERAALTPAPARTASSRRQRLAWRDA